MRYLIICLLLTTFSCTNTTTNEKDQLTKDSTSTTKELKIPVDSTLTFPDPLIITPLNVEGNLGQITFTQKGKTLLYWNLKTKKGLININKTDYILDNLDFSATSGTYVLKGNGVTVTAPQVKYKANTGEDCGYGTFDEIAVLLKDNVLKIAKVEVQDCPDY